jgi:hypothetical protein
MMTLKVYTSVLDSEIDDAGDLLLKAISESKGSQRIQFLK